MTRTYELAAAAALLVAVVATACSESDTPPPARSSAPATSRPLAATPVSTRIIDPPAAPAPQGPVSFADGEAAYAAKDYAAATRVFAAVVAERPDQAWGHYMLGLSAWKHGDLETAESAFAEALDRDPHHLKSLTNLGRVRLDAKRPGDALEPLNRAADINPLSGEVHRLLGRAFHAAGQTDEAVEAYRRAIELDPKDGWAFNNLGLLLLEQGRAAEALPLLAKAVDIRKDVPAFHNNLGMALEHTGRFSAAATAYAGALAADPKYDKAQRNLARVEQVKQAPEEPFEGAIGAAPAVTGAGDDPKDDVAGQ